MNARTRSSLSLLCAFHLAAVDLNAANAAIENVTPVISRIPRQRVDSTAIAAIGYSKRLHVLEVEFVNGAIYRYLGIKPLVFHELMIADSKTRYYDTKIRGNYASLRVRLRAHRSP